MKELRIANVKVVPEFANVPDEQLQWLINKGEAIEMEEGDILFNEGDPVTKTFIVLDGKIRICTTQSGQLREIASIEKGGVTGYLPFSRAVKAFAYCECVKPSWIFICSADSIKQGITQHYELTEALVHMMSTRVRETTATLQQNEKMFALGKLSAGLAHELNNPAAAISRAASLLQSQVRQLPHLFKTVSGLHVDQDKIEKIQQLVRDKINSTRPVLSMLQKADVEDELTSWLEDHHIEKIDTEGLTEMNFTVDDLEIIKNCLTKDELVVVLEWIGNFLVTNKMAEDIRISSERISELVGAVKNFTFMDKASDKQMIDIHTGIRNTLTILNYKLKSSNVIVVENYDETIQKIKAFPGDLNQVWTNLIDNAIDAMEVNKKGMLEISTTRDGQFVKVVLKDDGPGIAKDIQQKIFDPFFTTKEMGMGSGLGLDVVSRIIRQHNGSIKVNSRPGDTEFEVCLPVNN